jgi:hypothetical protein
MNLQKATTLNFNYVALWTSPLLDFIDRRLNMMPKTPNASINQLLDGFNKDKRGCHVSHDEANSALSQVVSDELSEGFFCNRFRRKLDGSIAFNVRGRIGHALWVVDKTGNTTALIRFNEWIKKMCCEIENMQIVDCENITRLILDRIFLPNLQSEGLGYG